MSKENILGAFDELNELVVWFLLITGTILRGLRVFSETEYLVGLALVFFLISGFKLRKFRLGKLELTAGAEDK